jgi:TPR repeat protein
MRISKMRWGLLGILLIAGLLAGGADHTRAAPTSANHPAGGDEYALAERALREGQIAYGIETLQQAAQRGGIRAQLRLAKIYAEGKFLPRDEVKACELYSALADRYSQIDRTDAAAKLIAEAFRAWATCYARGAPSPQWQTNLSRAAVLYYQAGVILDDAESLYELANMFMTGQGIAQNPRLAVHYFFSAARKRYAPAQAMLGSMMWEGKLVKRQPVNGLALIVLALESAKPEDKAWIDSIHQEALILASKEEESQAIRLAHDWKKAYDAETTGAAPPMLLAVPQIVPPPVRAPGAPPHVAGQRQLATPQPGTATQPAAKPMEQQNEYGTMPTGVNVPATASPPAE